MSSQQNEVFDHSEPSEHKGTNLSYDDSKCSNPDLSALQKMAADVERRKNELAVAEEEKPLDPLFVKACLDANERGDGVLFATLNAGKFLFNVTPKDGEWYTWEGNVWKIDEIKRSFAAVEKCALEYQQISDTLAQEIEEQGIDKKHEEAFKIKLKEKYDKRISRLRTVNGVSRTLTWAPVVDTTMACREEDFDKDPWLLPVENGVINLRTGNLEQGKQSDLLTRSLRIAYDPHADYSPFQNFLDEIANDKEISSFLKRTFGYAITGHSFEQFIWVFIGPGRNGKGVLFSLLSDILGPYYHEISRAMLIEQRNEQSPSAASEHKYSLLGKRIIVGAETNRGQKIDAAAVKNLTGDDIINCRPLFKKEINFRPSHTLFLHTNNMPLGLTREFSLIQRLLRIDFPFMYVDDIDAEKKKFPARADYFRKKDPLLKEKLKACRQGILRWLVEGCLEWQQTGLTPPRSIIESVASQAKEEDYIGQFYTDCLDHHPDNPKTQVSCTTIYNAFKWWASHNMDERESKRPSIRTINTMLRERGHLVEKKSGRYWLYNHTIKLEILEEISEES